MSGFQMEDYNDVPARIAEFRAKHPEGSLQPADPCNPFQVLDIGGQTFIAYTAAAYRSPDDPRPGIACAYEQFPGRTSFTKGSELQNAETSAWGRAIVAALAADAKKSVASAEEIRNRRAEQEQPQSQSRPQADPPTEPQQLTAKQELWQESLSRGWSATKAGEEFEKWSKAGDSDAAGIRITDATDEQVRQFLSDLRAEMAA